MLALVVIASPNPNSLCHAMASVCVEALVELGYEIAFHDLYAEQFDPVQPTGEQSNTSSTDQLVERHCVHLAAADLILVLHPNWWGQLPAILKGWVDRVFRLHTAYSYPAGVGPEGVPVGLLKARVALVFNTSNTPSEREAARFGDPLETLWKNCIFGLCGVSSVIRRMYSPASASTPEQRTEWIAEVKALTHQAADLAKVGVEP
jgi:NAD(P)H dehydrogenase (quinone)